MGFLEVILSFPQGPSSKVPVELTTRPVMKLHPTAALSHLPQGLKF